MRYLKNVEHKNHKGKTEEIWSMFGRSKNVLRLAVIEGANKDCVNGLRGKGGRPIDTLMHSFVFSLPDTVPRPTKEQWKAITKDIMYGLSDFLDVDPKELSRRSFSNVHNEQKPHLNLVVGRIWNGEIKNKIKQRAVLVQLKRNFNKAVLTHLGVSHLDYNPKENNLGNMNKWQWEQRNAKQQQQKIQDVYSISKKLLDRFALQLGKWIEGKQPIKRANNTLEQAKNKIELTKADLEMFNDLIKKAEKQKGETSGLTIKNKCSKCKTKTVTIKNAICSNCTLRGDKMKR